MAITLSEVADRLIKSCSKAEILDFVNDEKRIIEFFPNETGGKYLKARNAAVRVLNECYTKDLKKCLKNKL